MTIGFRIGAAVLLALPLFAASPKYSAATNFEVNLLGEPDTRPDTWGTAGVAVWTVRFLVPSGHHVRILRVYGDFLVWPRGRVPEGTYAGALFGLLTAPPDTTVSRIADLVDDSSFLYVQLATGGKPERAGFDNMVTAGGLLGDDNTLYVKVAVWLNDTGLPIHIEPTWVTVLQIEDNAGNPVGLGEEVRLVASNGRQIPKKIMAKRIQ